ncbi:Cupin superfamily protein [Raoultella terrigena]|uniref:Cupin superfamily protein n=1 Tax=Raoultella terrigena TaxID=577 RepID=A0A4U9CWZ4_RAOTE|nr:Cupin superfamily protein [Raoultella terrigena]
MGYRAPNARELFSGFADYILQRELGSQRYADPDVPSREHPADILPVELDRLREMMLELINQPEHFKQWYGEFIYPVPSRAGRGPCGAAVSTG